MTKVISNITKKVFWGIMFAVPILVVSGLALKHSMEQGIWNAPVFGFSSKADSINLEWSKLNYTNISSSFFLEKIENLVEGVTNKPGLTEKERKLLNEKLLSFFNAYSVGKYNAYQEFRMPKGASFVWKEHSTLGTLDGLLQGLHIPDKVVEKLSNAAKLQALLVGLNGHGTVFSNYFVGVCFDESRINIRKYTGTVPSLEETEFFGKDSKKEWCLFENVVFPNVGSWSQKESTFIQFDDSINSIISRGDEVLVADSFFMIRRDKALPIMPIALRLYWDVHSEQWLPDDLIICDMLLEGKVKGMNLPIL